MGIPVKIEHTEGKGFRFITPWPMTQKALQNACIKANQFYTQLYKDFLERGRQEDADRTARALEDLRQNRVRNVVDSGMVDDYKLTGLEKPEINFPGGKIIS